MNTKSLSKLFLLALLILAFASTSAQAHGWGSRPINPCWHPCYGGGCYGGGYVPLFTINLGPGPGPQLPPPAPAPTPGPYSQTIPVGFADGTYLHSPWSNEVIPLANLHHRGQVVYDAQTGLPFRAP